METLSQMLLTFLLNSLWQVPLIAAIAWLISQLLRTGPARHLHALWMLALLAALVLPLASLRTFDAPPLPGAPSTEILPAPQPTPHTQVALAAIPGPAPTQIHISLAGRTARFLLGAYALFFLFRLAMLGLAFRRTAKLRHASVPARPAPLAEAVWQRAASSLGIADAELRTAAATSPVSSRVVSPIMIGCWRKTIILPEHLLSETSEEVLTTAIGHEMAHLARHDYSLNIAAELLALPVYFQPAIWLMRRAVTRTRELACDELVTNCLIGPAAYAKSMVTLAHDAAGIPRPGHALGVFDGNILEERVRRLLQPRAINLKTARLMLAGGLSALAISVMVASGLTIAARAQSAALPEMKLAEAAFNSGNFSSAAEHFQSAVNLDPGNINARLFLANALLNAAGSGGSNEAVLHQYDEVVARAPGNQTALYGLATLGGPDRWQKTHSRLLEFIAAEPTNAHAYYTVGVMDWQFAFQPLQQVAGGTDAGLRRSLRDKYQTTVEEGLRMMQMASRLYPGNPDALAYLNLLCREAAAISETDGQRTELTAQADDFVRKAMAAQKTRGAVQVNSSHINVEGTPPAGVVMRAPPPPPPPPPPPGYVPRVQ